MQQQDRMHGCDNRGILREQCHQKITEEPKQTSDGHRPPCRHHGGFQTPPKGGFVLRRPLVIADQHFVSVGHHHNNHRQKLCDGQRIGSRQDRRHPQPRNQGHEKQLIELIAQCLPNTGIGKFQYSNRIGPDVLWDAQDGQSQLDLHEPDQQA